ncbi:substrate-binding periplasmic protein [Pseudoduganella violaceinigra]|uniref:substrate-binding periplasmic protein n=1 Tax=Pseudoduganella violaceinigra TaxID=246602 RepID=UPI00041D8372|nr:transporter substrate-binding domain-containing protein [Pseudoduganella violaceinigra]
MPILTLLVALLPAGAQADTVTVYTSANFAPLVIDGTRGIYHEAIDYLNKQATDGTSFRLAYLPRKRLQMRLEDGSLDGIVIGMMPQWFDDVAQKKYLWTTAFAIDRFVLVSRAEHPVQPDTQAVLAGKSIGLTLGYVYPGIDEWIHRHGLVRQDAMSEEINMEKLRRGRIDCVAVSESVARYFVRLHGLASSLTLVDLPGRATERRFLVPMGRNDLYDKVAPIVKRMRDDPQWLRMASKYQ